MSAKMNVPQLRFSEFSEKWEEKKLGSLFSFKNGINASKEQYGKGYKFINVLDIINNNVITHNDIIGSVDVSKEIFEKNKVEYGNILFQRSSETRVDAGQTNVYLDKNNPSTFGGFIIRGQQKGNEYNPLFMNYMFKTQHSRKEITTKSNGSTRYNVGQETLSNVLVYLPKTQQEQEKIASFLSSVDTKIEQLTSKAKLLQEYKKGVMQKIFSQEIRFKDDDGSEYPEWVEMRYGDVYSFYTTNSFSRDNLNYKGGEVKNIHYGDIHTKFSTMFKLKNENVPFVNNELDLSKIKEESYCQDGDLVIADASEDYADIGKTIELISLNNEKVLAGLHTFLARPNKHDMALGYAGYLLQSWKVRWQVMRESQGTKVLSLSTKRLSNVILTIPSKPEQTKIANFLSSIDSKIEQVQKQLDSTKEFKKALLQQMFV